MSHHAIRGGCRCGRNHYIVQPPPDATEAARVLFTPEEAHRSSLASPLPAFLRVPLSWYHSSTTSFYDDETPAMIHRVYEQASPGRPVFSQRRFCGFCGTPLSFWSETPRLEADYIRLALGSLYAQDLNRLDDWGAVIEGGEESDEQDEPELDESRSSSKSSSTGLPWLDRFVEGSRLDRQLLLQQQQSRRISAARIHRHDVGSATRPDGSVVEWEVVEWTEGDADSGDAADDDTASQGHPSPAKRQKHGGDGDDVPAAMDVEPSRPA